MRPKIKNKKLNWLYCSTYVDVIFAHKSLSCLKLSDGRVELSPNSTHLLLARTAMMAATSDATTATATTTTTSHTLTPPTRDVIRPATPTGGDIISDVTWTVSRADEVSGGRPESLTRTRRV